MTNFQNKSKQTDMSEWEKERAMTRLPKRLAYILRYGALKEGLAVDDNGYVDLEDLITVDLLQDYTKDELLDHIKTSVSYRDVQRYNIRERDDKVFVRAAYLRNFEKNPYHPGTKVPTLFESSMSYILVHLQDYDLEDFPDENIIRTMIRRLKRQKKLSSKALKELLVPTLTRLNLEGIYLTNNIMRCVWTQCPNLMAVSLQDCGYIMTDKVLDQFVKNLPKLERLNLCLCNHLTSKCLSILTKHLPRLKTLYIASVPSLTYEVVFNYIKASTDLIFLDVFSLKKTPEQYDQLMQLANEKGVELILKTPWIRREVEAESETSKQDSDDQSSNSSEKALLDLEEEL